MKSAVCNVIAVLILLAEVVLNLCVDLPQTGLCTDPFPPQAIQFLLTRSLVAVASFILVEVMRITFDPTAPLMVVTG
jgi:hypothetical protein